MLGGRFELLGLLLSCLFIGLTTAYEVPVDDTDYSRQICSGMWASDYTYINVSFDATSQGQLAMVIYEWSDARYLGKVTEFSDEDLPKTYVCTTNAISGGYCNASDSGKFILDLPSGLSINQTSFWSASMAFNTSKRDFSPWQRDEADGDTLNPSPAGLLYYNQPINYKVRKTGYYCVAIVPVTILSIRQGSTDVPYHPKYHGSVFFRNTFNGMLPATDYPKVNFYFVMSLVYTTVSVAWALLCWKHQTELLPIQYYLSSLFGILIIEMIAYWAYYRYLNAHGRGSAATVFLIVVAIIDAGRNALSFFLLLIVSLGLSVMRESLGKTMIRCQLLAAAHFVFGVLYAIGIVELELESTSALVLLLFVIPLAFTLSGFLMWILYALNGTIAELRARKQRYKLSMFRWLHRILLGAVIVIGAFFVVSSFSFSGRLAEDYASKSWKVRWWLLDGWLALLYFSAFCAISYLWRPLAMSDEIAQDEEDAEDYDLESIEARTRAREDDDDDATLVGRREGPDSQSVGEDHVVFEIGDEEDEDEENPTKRRDRRSGDRRRVSREEDGNPGTTAH